MNRNNGNLSSHELGLLRERVDAIQAQLAELAVPNTRFRPGYWNSLRDYLALVGKSIKVYCDEPVHGAEICGDIVRVGPCGCWHLGS